MLTLQDKDLGFLTSGFLSFNITYGVYWHYLALKELHRRTLVSDQGVSSFTNNDAIVAGTFINF